MSAASTSGQGIGGRYKRACALRMLSRMQGQPGLVAEAYVHNDTIKELGFRDWEYQGTNEELGCQGNENERGPIRHTHGKVLSGETRRVRGHGVEECAGKRRRKEVDTH